MRGVTQLSKIDSQTSSFTAALAKWDTERNDLDAQCISLQVEVSEEEHLERQRDCQDRLKERNAALKI